MAKKISISDFEALQQDFAGELYYNHTPAHQAQKVIYATDASVYQEKPLAVAIPRHTQDIQKLIQLARQFGVTLIPRSAGTSLAGQVVGKGIVVDISKYMTGILELNVEERWVRVQPGVIRDDLNAWLKPHGLLFGPETSTASRAMIGGMIGNNSCGLHSIVWGATRDHLLEAKVLLHDGTEVLFAPLDKTAFYEKARLQTTEGQIYRDVHRALNNPFVQEQIDKSFPKKALTRRNTGYALDILSDNLIFNPDSTQPFNMCRLLAGSEGTLAFVTEATLQLLPLPPQESALICIHCNSIQEAMQANLIALAHQPMASELVDKYILDFTKGHPEYEKTRFFIEGDPAAILMVELMDDSQENISSKAQAIIADLQAAKVGYAYPIVRGAATKPAWDVRKAGLGLIRNLPGDTQPVNLIEDCAVLPEDLPAYIDGLEKILAKHQLHASYYAHAGAGELHVEPMINLKTSEGQQLFRTVLAETATLVKSFGGSLSGEHGDGRLRGEFIPMMMGEQMYQLFKEIKQIFDPKRIFNAHKIVDTPPMNAFLRYEADQTVRPIATTYHFDKQESMLRLAEKCSGSGDCRKTHISGGTMCPSYMATRQEKDTTRARANVLRQFLTQSDAPDRLAKEEIKEVMDLCLSCKACKAECPSQVDIAKMKGEFLQHYYDKHGVPFRTKIIGNFTQSQRWGMLAPSIYNWAATNGITSKWIKQIVGFAPERSLPTLGKTTLRHWYLQQKNRFSANYFQQLGKKTYLPRQGKVYLFCDEFTNYNDLTVGQQAIWLLEALGFEVIIPEHLESGRTYLSKGLIKDAQRIAQQNVAIWSQVLAEAPHPIVGIEPSAILTLRDEYLDLVPVEWQEKAQLVAQHSFLLDEFLGNLVDQKQVQSSDFSTEPKLIKLHGHCHQKALSSLVPTKKFLSLPKHYEVQLIPSGCCGMAGSFGYEAEHYEISMQIGELVLFPVVRQQDEGVLIAAPGTSCRHQIKDGTGRKAQHPVEILWEALL